MLKVNVPELELKILKIMWDLNTPSTVQVVIDNWTGEPKPGYTTILKKLQVMEKKKFVDHKKKGRAYSYFPVLKKEDVTKTKFKTLLSDLFGGNKLEMAAAFVKDTNLTKDDIQGLLDQLNKEDNNE